MGGHTPLAVRIFGSCKNSKTFKGMLKKHSFLGFLLPLLLIPLFSHSAFAADPSMTLSSSGIVDLTTSSGNTVITHSNIHVATDCKAGYYLTLNTSVNDNKLYLNGNSSATSFLPTNGKLNESPNTWGFFISDSAPTASSIFSPVPALGSTPAPLKDPDGTASESEIDEEFSVYYGAYATADKDSGTYKLKSDSSNNDANGVLTYNLTVNPSCFTSLEITFNKNLDGEGGEEDPGETVSNFPSSSENVIDTENSTVTLSDKTPIRSDYIFKEWNTSPAGTGNYYYPGETANIGNNTSAGELPSDATLYAIWIEECSEGYVCYDGNHANAGTMDSQYLGNGSTNNLLASNFSRAGYGFAGWNTMPDGTGTNYGPNQNITMPDSGGLILYANWIKASGTLQTWNGASSMNVGDVVALRDSRDNEVYTVAKLADDNVWITENLRLVPRTANITEYNTNSPTSNFLSAYPSSSSSSSQCSYSDESCTDKVYYYANNINRSFTPSYDSSDNSSSWYSYGVMYNWYTATAGNGGYNTSGETTAGDICPAGWHLPTGGESGEFESLGTALGGADGEENSALARSYPNNFVYGGNYNPGYSSPTDRGSYAYYWSSAANDYEYSYYLIIDSSSFAQSYYNYKWNNYAARCIYQGGNDLLANVTVDFSDSRVSSVTFANDTYGTEIATSQNPVVTIAKNTNYTITADLATGYDIASWIAGANATLDNQSQNPTTLSVTGNSTLAFNVTNATPLTINYHGNGLTFDNDATENAVKYYTSTTTHTEEVTRYSHTPNIDDEGNQNGDYPNDANINDVVSIPGAESLHVSLTYQTESTSYDWVSFWEGSHPDYSAGSDYESGIVCDNEGPQYGNDYLTTVECDIPGDTVTFGFYSDGSVSNYYGYYAVVTGSGVTTIRDLAVVEGSYATPTSTTPHLFLGWSEDQDAATPTFTNEADIKANLQVRNGETVDLYAVYKVAYPVTVYLDANTTSVTFYNADYGTTTVTTSGGVANILNDAPYIITASHNVGYKLTSWSTDENGALDDSTANPTIFTITDASTLTATSEKMTPLTINYYSNGLSFDDDATENTVKYYTDNSTNIETITRYSHTPNIDDDGVQDSENPDYPSYSETNEVITIPGAESLHISLTYQTPNEYDEWVSFWAGDYPDYSAQNDYYAGVVCDNKGPQYGGYEKTTIECDISGDTVTFGFHSYDYGSGSGYYGYYAVITASAPVEHRNLIVDEGSYATPTADFLHTFLGWSEDQYANTPTYTDEADIKANLQAENGDTVDLYAVYITPVDVTVNFDEHATSVGFYSATFGTQILTPANSTDNGDGTYTGVVHLYRSTDYLVTGTFDTANGYFFNGWTTTENGTLGNPYSSTTTYTVYDTATLSLASKFKTGATTLLPGEELNSKLYSIGDYNYDNVRVLRMAEMLPDGFELSEDNIVSVPDSEKPVYAFLDNTDGAGILYFYTEARDIYMNEDSKNAFRNFSNLADISALSDWKTDNVVNMSGMFASNYSRIDTSALANWNTSNVTDMSSLFEDTFPTNLDGLANWDTSSVTNMSGMFRTSNQPQNSRITNLDALANWDTSSVTNMSGMFYGAGSLTDLDGLANWDTSSVINMSYTFASTHSLTDIDALANWDTSSVTDMGNTFYNVSSLTNLNALANWDISSVTNLYGTFSSTSALTDIDALANWDTSSVTNMNSTFSFTSALTNIDALVNWDTSSVTDMSYTFSSAHSLTNLNALANWDTSNVVTVREMFSNTNELVNASAINDWDIRAVKAVAGSSDSSNNSFYRMFYYSGGSWNSSLHPEFTKRSGTWNSEGTFIPGDTTSDTVTVTVIFDEHINNVTVGTSTIIYTSGNTVSLTRGVSYGISISTDPGYELAAWDSGEHGVVYYQNSDYAYNPYQFIATGDTTLTVTSQPIPNDITTTVNMDSNVTKVSFCNDKYKRIYNNETWSYDYYGCASVSENGSTVTLKQGETYKARATTKSGYEVTSWTTTAGTLSNDSGASTDFTPSGDNTLTVTSSTLAPTHTVTVNMDSNVSYVVFTSPNWPTKVAIRNGFTVELRENTPYTATAYTKSGYELTSWSTTANGTLSNNSTNPTTYTISGDATLTANSSETSSYTTTVDFSGYNISSVTFFNGDFGSQTATPSDPTVSLRQGVNYMITAALNIPYEFIGWETTANGTLGDATLNPTIYTITNDTTLTPKSQEIPTYEVTVSMGDGASGVTFTNSDYGTQTISANGGIATLRRGIEYVITATTNDGFDFSGWTTTSDGTLGSTTTNPTTYAITNDSTLSLTVKDNRLLINYDGNGLYYNNDPTDTNNPVYYLENTRYSHTPNVSNEGVANSTYASNSNITDTVTINGATSLNVTIYYDAESANYDWVSVYQSPFNISNSNDATASSSTGNLSGKLTGRKSGRTKNYTTWYSKTYTVSGDTVKFHFKSDTSSNFYGYYAIITPTTDAIRPVSGTYAIPSYTSQYTFLGWSEDQNATTPTYTNEADIIANSGYKQSDSPITLYAIYEQATIVTVNFGDGVSSVSFYNATSGVQNITTNGGTAGLKANAEYIITATTDKGVIFNSWSTTNAGTLGDTTANPTSYSVTDDAVLSLATDDNRVLINYHGNGLYYNNDQTDTVNYVYYYGDISNKHYSHTSNVNYYGTANSNYASNSNTTDTVTIDGATSLLVTIYYDTESASSDWVSVYQSPFDISNSNDTTASSSTGNLSGKLAGRNYGRTNKYSTWYSKTYTVSGDTVKFHFKSDGIIEYYGYYAVVTPAVEVSSGTYAVPSSSLGHTFLGWSEDQNATTPTYTDEADLLAHFNYTHSDSPVDLYAIYSMLPVTVTVDLDEHTSSVKFKNNSDSTDVQTVTTDGDTVSLKYDSAYTITATPSVGYEFSSWSTTENGTLGSTTTNPTTYSVTNTATLSVATQHKPVYNVTVNFDSGISSVSFYNADLGIQSATTSGETVSLTQEVEYTITASTNTDYRFDYWSNGANSTIASKTINPTTFSVTGSSTLNVASASAPPSMCVKEYRLQNADGSYPDTYTSDGSELMAYGATCSYTKTVENYQTMSNTKTVIDGATISLDLPRDVYELTINKNTTFIDSVAGAGSYRWGQEVDIRAIASQGSRFTGWSQTAGTTSTFGNSTSDSTTFTMPIGDATIYANGEAIPYSRHTVTVNLDEHVTGITISNPECGDHQISASGSTVSLCDNIDYLVTSTYDSEYITDAWTTTPNGALSSTNTARTTYAITGDATLSLTSTTEKTTTLVTGKVLNNRMKSLAEGKNVAYDEASGRIQAIRMADSLPEDFTPNDSNTISISGSAYPVYIFYDNTGDIRIMYLYTDANVVYMNQDSSYAFDSHLALADISALSFLNTSNVTNMNHMFSGYHYIRIIGNDYSFVWGNSALTNLDALANWDTSNVTNMANMFINAKSLTNINALANWDTSKVTSMGSMFEHTLALTNIDALVNWDTSNVTNMSGMFCSFGNTTFLSGGSALANIDGVRNWDTSKVTDMSYMFHGASSLTNVDALANWDTSNVTNMEQMLFSAKSLTNINGLAKWNTGKVTNMGGFFGYIWGDSNRITNLDALASWDTSSVTDMDYMFGSVSSITNVDALANWNTSKVTHMGGMFYGNKALVNIDGLADWDTSEVTKMFSMFEGDRALVNIDGLADWDTSEVINMSNMFDYAASLTNIDALANWDTSKVTDMGNMFSSTALTNINGALNWDTGNVEKMWSMFYAATSLTNIDGARNWDTSNVYYMSRMFEGATSLTNVDGARNWDTGNVTQMDSMFKDTTSLTNIDALANWDTSEVTTMSQMFSNTTALTSASAIDNWEIGKVSAPAGSTGSNNNFNSMFYCAGGDCSSPIHPNFTKRAGTWDSSGTFIPDSNATPTNQNINNNSLTSLSAPLTASNSNNISSTTEDQTELTQNSNSNYITPQGVSQTGNSENGEVSGDNIAPALAIATVTAATSGIVFFVLARRKKDEDEDDE